MAEYFRTYTPPVASPVTLDCELVATRRPRYPNDPGAYTGEPDPQDIRGHLDAQTDEYRAEVLAPSRDGVDDIAADECGQCDQIHELLWGKPNRVKGDKLVEAVRKLQSQLSAATAERNEALKLPHRGTIAELRNRVKDFEIDLTSARETIRKLEAEKAKEQAIHEVHEGGLRSAWHGCRDGLATAQETIRALTEERDVAGRVGWIAGQQASGRKLFADWKGDGGYVTKERWVVQCMTPYEPPRSEEGKPARCDATYHDGQRCSKEPGHDGWHQAGTGLEVAQWDGDVGPRPGERPSSDYSAGAIAIARDSGKLRVTEDGCGWIRDMAPDQWRLPKVFEAPCVITRADRLRVERGTVGAAMFTTSAEGVSISAHDAERLARWLVSDPTKGPTRLAPLADRERAIVAAAERWQQERSFPTGDTVSRRYQNEIDTRNALVAAIDLPKTPDVRMGDGPRCPHGYPLCDFCDDPTNPSREQLREKLRLATEQVEALERFRALTQEAKGGLGGPQSTLLRIRDASGDYERLAKEKGWTW